MTESNLIERLREMANPKRVGSHFHPLYGEAADEIERLRALLEEEATAFTSQDRS